MSSQRFKVRAPGLFLQQTATPLRYSHSRVWPITTEPCCPELWLHRLSRRASRGAQTWKHYRLNSPWKHEGPPIELQRHHRTASVDTYCTYVHTCSHTKRKEARTSKSGNRGNIWLWSRERSWSFPCRMHECRTPHRTVKVQGPEWCLPCVTQATVLILTIHNGIVDMKKMSERVWVRSEGPLKYFHLHTTSIWHMRIH